MALAKFIALTEVSERSEATRISLKPNWDGAAVVIMITKGRSECELKESLSLLTWGRSDLRHTDDTPLLESDRPIVFRIGTPSMDRVPAGYCVIIVTATAG